MVGGCIGRVIPAEFRNSLFAVCIFAAALVELTQKAGFHWSFVHSYLSDLVCMPVFISSAQFLEKKVTGNIHLKYDLYKIIGTFIVISLTYEVLLPMKSPEYTSDIADVLCYAVGCVAYYLYHFRWEKKVVRA